MSEERHGLLASGKRTACAQCGGLFVPTGPRSRYCPKCRPETSGGRSKGHVTDEKKFCQRCQEWKYRYRDFYEKVAGTGRYTTYCKECSKTLAMLYGRAANRALQERKAGGSGSISPQLYAHLCREQNGVCASCGEPEMLFDPETQLPRRLIFYVNANGVRGLICFLCDLGAKGVRDSAVRAAKLAAFLGQTAALVGGEVRIHADESPELPEPDVPIEAL